MASSKFIILGAGKPFAGDKQLFLKDTDLGSSTLRWMLDAVGYLEPDVHFVGGYNHHLVKETNPNLTFCHNPKWQETGAAASLLTWFEANPDAANDMPFAIVSYSDIVYREEAIRQIMAIDADIVIAVDRRWRHRYGKRRINELAKKEKVVLSADGVRKLGAALSETEADGEFLGLARFSPEAMRAIAEMQHLTADDLSQANLSELIERLRKQGLNVAYYDVAGDWAEHNFPGDLARFVLTTKAQTLSRLKKILKLGRVEEQVSFTVGEWRADQLKHVSDITQTFGVQNVIIRSSALSEDGFQASLAGAHDSVLNVDSTEPSALQPAIEQVIASYKVKHDGNEVLVQPMLQNVIMSGVVFSRTLGRGAPYLVINYDDESGQTDTVTSGQDGTYKTVFILRNSTLNKKTVPAKLMSLIACFDEIEQLLNYNSLDVEFAVTGTGEVHILQVRPLITGAQEALGDATVFASVAEAQSQFAKAQKPNAGIVGSRTIFGIMPDWNPAEIIGKRPTPMALSLYRHVICEDTWAQQRAEFGYRDVRPQPLLRSFCGHGYVDVRASLNSFVPCSVPDETAEKIVSFCLTTLEQNPERHDKVEFDVIPTSMAFDFPDWQAKFENEAGLTPSESQNLKDGLTDLTNECIVTTSVLLKKLTDIENNFSNLIRAELPTLAKAFVLLDDARNNGALLFAHLARCGFVAVSLLRSAVNAGVLSEPAKAGFLSTIRTVSHQFTEDALACRKKDLAFDDFVNKYGHLRPGTYDITAPNYRANQDVFLHNAVRSAATVDLPKVIDDALNDWHAERHDLQKQMAAIGLDHPSEVVERFLRDAIEGRELAKFLFTRNISAALDLMTAWGQENGLTAEDLSMLTLADMRAISETDARLHRKEIRKDWLQKKIFENRGFFDVTLAVELPPLLCAEKDFVCFTYPNTEPNFVGSRAVSGPAITVQDAQDALKLEGRIIIIENADPGYDWVFSQNIAGIITMYGGANSHMAIRAAEFGVPAAIGVGLTQYDKLIGARTILLDPANHAVKVID